jgi:chromosome partitioning protein
LGFPSPDKLPVTLTSILGKIMTESEVSQTEGVIHHSEGIDLIPASIELSGLEISLVNAMSRETVLRQYLALLKPHYDYIILDCPPSLSMLTINALAASDFVIVPVVAQYLPAKGLELLLKTIARVKKQINPGLEIGGILHTMVDRRTNFAKEMIGLIEDAYGGKINILKGYIPFSIRAAEASAEGKSIFTHDPRGKVAAAYEALVEEVLEIAR